MNALVNRFLRYAQIDTQSDETAATCPSTEKQWNLARLLKTELEELGLKNVNLDDNCYITATLPANIEKETPVLGLIAHMDTAPDFSGYPVRPQIIENYDGQDIMLNPALNVVLSPKEFPELTNYIGQTLITTDGTTLLGADDKAGIAEIMEAVAYLITHPEIPHGTIKIGFTPDEEIGRGADKFPVNSFDADFAYTVDGGELGELEYENFNAAGAKIIVRGRNVHPGTAKNKMLNSQTIAMEFHQMLPAQERPEHTEHREGFFHLTNMEGNVEQTTLHYIIRNHDSQKFSQQKELMKAIAALLNQKYTAETVKIEIKSQYRNMREKIEPVFHIVDLAKSAMEECAIQPLIRPVRGGTDGARLSFMGLPTPNLFTGGHNFHGRFEFIPVASMHKAVEVLLKIIEKLSNH